MSETKQYFIRVRTLIDNKDEIGHRFESPDGFSAEFESEEQMQEWYEKIRQLVQRCYE